MMLLFLLPLMSMMMMMTMMMTMQEKYEWWWIYMCDAKRKQLLAGPLQICTLGDLDEVLPSRSVHTQPLYSVYYGTLQTRLQSAAHRFISRLCFVKID